MPIEPTLPLLPDSLPPSWWPAVQQAAKLVLGGGVVAYPTETVWGLAAHPACPEAIARLYELKGRELAKPVQVSCQDALVACQLAQPNAELEILSVLWPGPLTLVLPASAQVPAALAPEGRVGLRVPDHPVALALLRLTGGWLATTSCNRSGQPAALTFHDAQHSGLGDLTLPDGGVPALGQASTVFALPERKALRSGAVSQATLLELLLRADGQPEAQP